MVKRDIGDIESFKIEIDSIVHDLNNLFTVISLNLTTVLSTEFANTVYGKNLKKADYALTIARGITNRLLSEDCSEKINKEKINIKELLDPIVECVLSGFSVDCSVVIDRDVKEIYVDRIQFIQVFHNLILNAMEATIDKKPSGRIKIVVANQIINEKDKKEGFGAGEYTLFTIQDNGCGISSDVAKNIFEPYFTTKKEGCGLGLSSSKAKIKNHDGYICMESEKGVGSTFFVYLP